MQAPCLAAYRHPNLGVACGRARLTGIHADSAMTQREADLSVPGPSWRGSPAGARAPAILSFKLPRPGPLRRRQRCRARRSHRVLAPTGPGGDKYDGTAPASGSSKSTSRLRGTVPARPGGGRSFDSSSSNAGTGMADPSARDRVGSASGEVTPSAMTSLASSRIRSPARRRRWRDLGWGDRGSPLSAETRMGP